MSLSDLAISGHSVVQPGLQSLQARLAGVYKLKAGHV
jgi:hypothetical protein